METKKFKAVIIDDEDDAREILKKLLAAYPEIKVVNLSSNVAEARAAVIANEPDIVFLDIEMPGKSGLDLAREIRDQGIETDIIFTTAFNQHAIEAFKVAAFDYLLKPVDPDKLSETLKRFREENRKSSLNEKLEVLNGILAPQKLRFNTKGGYIKLNPLNIIYFEADGNYTHVYLNSGRKECVSQQIGKIEDQLNHGFVRINRSVIINKEFIGSFERKCKKIKLINELEEIEFKVSSNLKELQNL
ncbi:MAG: LytTR family DNA-binding domain-containing protein [Bacteroidota bacterium]|nr:LytTR family DNA-binding domain-containing protein [Bacteroidota bacterium]